MKISMLQLKYPDNYSQTLSVMKQFMEAPYGCPEGTNLLVLPEYSNCPGISMANPNDFQDYCRRYNDSYIASMKSAALKTGITICFNMLLERETGFTNTTFIVDSTGKIICEYDKTHLAYSEQTPMGLIAGTKPVFVETLGAKLTFAVCFELYFPEFFERLAMGYPDIILCPSYQRSEDSEIIIKQAMGRALDTGAFLVRPSYSMGSHSQKGGNSYIVSPHGDIILNANQDTGFFSAEINPGEKRIRPLAHGLEKMPSREIVEKFRIPGLYRKNPLLSANDQNRFPKVCAHRGLSGLVPENTLPSFASALAIGANEIEFDVRLTKDNKMIVCHDATIDRVSDGIGKVSDLTFDEIRKLNAGKYMGWKDILFPTPEEIFNLLGGRIVFNIHVYDAGADGFVIKNLKSLIDNHGVSSTVYFAAQEREMAWCQELAPDISRCMLECFLPDRDIVDIALEYKCSRVQHFYSVYSKAIVEKARENGLISNLFFEDNPDNVKSRIDDGIDTILTNFADRIITAIKSL